MKNTYTVLGVELQKKNSEIPCLSCIVIEFYVDS